MKKALALAVFVVVWVAIKVIAVIDDMIVEYDKDDWGDDD